MKKIILTSLLLILIVSKSFSQLDKRLILTVGPAYTHNTIKTNSVSSSHNFFLTDLQLTYKIASTFSIGLTSGYQTRSGLNGIPLGGTMNYYFPGAFNQSTPDDDLALYLGINGGYVNILDNITPKPKISYFGGQVGLRLWGKNTGAYIEAGYGKSIISAGLCLKLI